VAIPLSTWRPQSKLWRSVLSPDRVTGCRMTNTSTVLYLLLIHVLTVTLSRSSLQTSPASPYDIPPDRHGWLTNPIFSGANKMSHTRPARKPPRRLATGPSDTNSSIVQRATPDDFLSFLIDGPFGGLEMYYESLAHRPVECDEQWHAGSVHSHIHCLL
jgi:hypothetical protein